MIVNHLDAFAQVLSRPHLECYAAIDIFTVKSYVQTAMVAEICYNYNYIYIYIYIYQCRILFTSVLWKRSNKFYNNKVIDFQIFMKYMFIRWAKINMKKKSNFFFEITFDLWVAASSLQKNVEQP